MLEIYQGTSLKISENICKTSDHVWKSLGGPWNPSAISVRVSMIFGSLLKTANYLQLFSEDHGWTLTALKVPQVTGASFEYCLHNKLWKSVFICTLVWQLCTGLVFFTLMWHNNYVAVGHSWSQSSNFFKVNLQENSFKLKMWILLIDIYIFFLCSKLWSKSSLEEPKGS